MLSPRERQARRKPQPREVTTDRGELRFDLEPLPIGGLADAPVLFLEDLLPIDESGGPDRIRRRHERLPCPVCHRFPVRHRPTSASSTPQRKSVAPKNAGTPKRPSKLANH